MKVVLLNILLGLTIFCFTGCETKIGDCKVYTEGNEVFVDGFNYTTGISGVNNTDFNVDFDELDEYIYNFCKKTTYSTVYVTLIAVAGEDKYGNKEYEKITIGAIDTEETEKYVDYSNWKFKYGTKRIFYKDKSEYNKKQRERTRGQFFSITPRYMPKSIK